MPHDTPRKAANGDGSVFSITKNGKKQWVAQVSLGADITGKHHSTRRYKKTETDAKKALRDMLHERDLGKLNKQTQETLGSLALHWVREVKPLSVRQTTASGYEYLLRAYVFPRLGRTRMSHLKSTDIQTLMWQLKELNLATNTINQIRRILNGFCNYAMRQAIIGHNPVHAVEPIKRQHDEATQVQKPWTLDESLSVLKAAPSDDQMDCFIHLMLLTGLRPGEALGLRWCDIDFEKNMLHVTGTLRVDRRILPNGDGVTRLTRNDPKTKASNRSLPIHPELLEALRRQQMRQGVWGTIGGPKWVESDYVICTSVGTAKDPNNNRQKFYQFLERIDVRRIRQHDMRHVVAIRALEADVRLEDVSQALGHTRLDTTKQIYAGNVPRLNDRFIQGIGDLFSVRARIEIPQPSPTDDI